MKPLNYQGTIDDAIRSDQAAGVAHAVKYVAFGLIVLAFGIAPYFGISRMATSSSNTEISSLSKNQSSHQEVPSDEELLKAREMFKEALSHYESNIQPLLENLEIKNWDQESVSAALETKKLAINSFAQGAYASALQQLQDSSEKAISLKEQMDDAFEGKYAEALAAFLEENISRARLALGQALNIKSTEPKALNLQSQIDVYPQIAKLYKQLDVARVENNLNKQIALLSKIIALDPDRNDALTALNSAKHLRLELEFQRYVDTGLRHLANGDFEAADRAYSNAQRIFPNRTELQVLANKLNRTEHEYTLDAVHEQLAALKAADDWLGISQLVTDAEVYFPSNLVIAEFKEAANEILRLRKEAAGYINQPHRLADSNIQSHAKKFIKESLPYLSKSPALSKDIRIIGDYIDGYSAKFPVTIVSDNKTHIVVKGTGIVGKTRQKIIQLPVGNYVVEGSCTGYRTKQVKLFVSNNQLNQILVVCDERI